MVRRLKLRENVQFPFFHGVLAQDWWFCDTWSFDFGQVAHSAELSDSRDLDSTLDHWARVVSKAALGVRGQSK